ncbi:MAG: hypothetical protein ACRDBH_04365 [Bosea sp. (in: a-proteobacteria)]
MAYALNAHTAGHAFSTETVAKTKPSFWTRLVNAMIESRMRSAQIELNRHLRFREELVAHKIAAVSTGDVFDRRA